MKIKSIAIDKLIPYHNNPRKDQAVDKVASSINEYGFQQPIVIDKNMVVVVGHTRLMGAKKLGLKRVPTVIADLSETQAKAYRIADNRINEDSTWDMELLNLEIAGLSEVDFDLDLLGFDSSELDKLLVNDEKYLTDEDEVPEPPKEPKSKLGDVYQLGEHRVMCGDSTNFNQIKLLMNKRKSKLLHADPPYGMGKEKEGVINDNLYKEKLDAFQRSWWKEFRPYLTDNASAYIWGNSEDLWRLWYSGGLGNSEKLTFRNEITWSKKNAQGIGSGDFRMFPTSSERALFFMLGEQGFNNNADNYWDGWEKIRKYLCNEKEKLGWNNKIVADFFGFHPRMADHWFSKSQWTMPKKEQYERLQKEARGNGFKKNFSSFKKDYNELKKEYDKLKKEFYSTRSYFDNAHENMTDVWEYDRVTGEERQGHATPKPVKIMERVMKSSLPKGGLCIEPFGGSGSTLMGAEKTNRICYMMELDPKYVDVIIERWENFTGKKAKKIC